MRDAAVFVSLSITQSLDEAYGLWQAAVHRKPSSDAVGVALDLDGL